MKKASLALLPVVLVVGACASAKFVAGPHLTLVQSSELPPPIGVDPNATVRPYTIGPSDKISVTVFGMADLTQKLVVDSGGRIALPLVGSVTAAGRGPEELAAEIADRLRERYVRSPEVSVNVEEAVSHFITVDGEVDQPGEYPVVGRMTLIRAIAAAKGTSEFAKLQDVVVYRTVGDRQMAALYNLGAIRRGLYPDPAVYASDKIVVGDSPGRRLFRDVLQASPLITTPIIALLQNNNN